MRERRMLGRSSVSGDAVSRRREIHRKETVRSVEAFQLHDAAIQKADLSSGEKITDKARHKDFAAGRLASDPGGVVHGFAVEVIRLLERIARMDSDSHPNRRRAALE